MTALGGAVELLDRSLAYTRVTLGDVTDDTLRRRTPCAHWRLHHLLEHMEDALDAFTEAAVGQVSARRPDAPTPDPGAHERVGVLRDKACTLLGAWSRPVAPDEVAVGDLGLASPVLVGTAALEITVHGWDVSQATGRGSPIPVDLADGLLTVAHQVVTARDRGVRFDRARPTATHAAYDVQLLAFLGRIAPP